MSDGQKGDPPPYPPPQGGRDLNSSGTEIIPSPLVGEGRVGGGQRSCLILLGLLEYGGSPAPAQRGPGFSGENEVWTAYGRSRPPLGPARRLAVCSKATTSSRSIRRSRSPSASPRAFRPCWRAVLPASVTTSRNLRRSPGSGRRSRRPLDSSCLTRYVTVGGGRCILRASWAGNGCSTTAWSR